MSNHMASLSNFLFRRVNITLTGSIANIAFQGTTATLQKAHLEIANHVNVRLKFRQIILVLHVSKQLWIMIGTPCHQKVKNNYLSTYRYISNNKHLISQNTFAMPVQEAMQDLIVKGATMVTLETLYKLETIVSHVIVMGTETFMKMIGVTIGTK